MRFCKLFGAYLFELYGAGVHALCLTGEYPNERDTKGRRAALFARDLSK